MVGRGAMPKQIFSFLQSLNRDLSDVSKTDTEYAVNYNVRIRWDRSGLTGLDELCKTLQSFWGYGIEPIVPQD